MEQLNRRLTKLEVSKESIESSRILAFKIVTNGDATMEQVADSWSKLSI